jgi:hypothetical protein
LLLLFELPPPPTKDPLLQFELAAPLPKNLLLLFELPTSFIKDTSHTKDPLLVTPDEPVIELFFNNEEITATNASSVELLIAVCVMFPKESLELVCRLGETRVESVIEVWLLDVDTATANKDKLIYIYIYVNNLH